MQLRVVVLALALLFSFTLVPAHAAEEPGYFSAMGKTWTRGFKNLVSFPWEIPKTIKEYDRKDDGNPRAFRDMAGFVDGSFRAVTRLGCGAWDIFFSMIPGNQEGLPLQPESFF